MPLNPIPYHTEQRNIEELTLSSMLMRQSPDFTFITAWIRVTELLEINGMLHAVAEAECKQKSHTGNPLVPLRGYLFVLSRKRGKGKYLCSDGRGGILGCGKPGNSL